MQTWQCDRSAAKQLFNSLVQTGTIDGWEWTNGLNEMPAFNRPRFVVAYAREANKLIDAMARRDPGIVELARQTLDASDKRDEELYYKSRALGVVMEVAEDKFLEIMETTATEQGWNIDCLMFDGGLLRKREGKTMADVEALLSQMEANIFDTMGLRMGLEVKEM